MAGLKESTDNRLVALNGWLADYDLLVLMARKFVHAHACAAVTANCRGFKLQLIIELPDLYSGEARETASVANCRENCAVLYQVYAVVPTSWLLLRSAGCSESLDVHSSNTAWW